MQFLFRHHHHSLQFFFSELRLRILRIIFLFTLPQIYFSYSQGDLVFVAELSGRDFIENWNVEIKEMSSKDYKDIVMFEYRMQKIQLNMTFILFYPVLSDKF
ncbi:hypothetical protein CSA_018805 [Cucumis sativus]|uniref:Uncharacterized protein n=2 Tax=Cucumis sativus TaxID=3659 RepID=A0ACB6HBE8_CUCSA|nr:hypothetical protein CSA_018805 [Cucumis sativus]